jgi:hypothetical protein
MKQNMRKTRVPVWDGNPESLPQMGKLFLYRGKKFSWRICSCGCGRPAGYLKGKLNKAMTIRLRGSDQGDAIYSVLVKLGKIEELIQAVVLSGKEAVNSLLEATLGEIYVQVGGYGYKAVNAFLDTKGISETEMGIATGEAIGLPFELAVMLAL